ncbi:MAG: RsmD family RNA methyltransferase, partial [Chloroflexi bacterium]|nr:RsmD family RNA methyltransferase [Chloroflexota bacterium]
MRVIAGTARGRTLNAPSGNETTRPMMDIVKGSLFNMLDVMGGIEDETVLDLFAGSGSLGIEALSRGAARVDFVEQSREACKV